MLRSRSSKAADSSQTCAAGCCEVDAIGAAEVAAVACPTAQSAASSACVPCASVQKIGREGAAAVASRLVGLVDVLRRDFNQSPSRHPEQLEQLQRRSRVHLGGGGVIKATDGGGNGARAASGAWEQAHRHRCLNVCWRAALGQRC
jgi:hypothetical protein